MADGAAALAAIRAHRPDLVLTDVMMPNLDGFGLLRALRADPATRATPVIMLSARAGEEAKVEGLHAGADDYLVKPFSARELVARVETHLLLNQPPRRRRERARPPARAVHERARHRRDPQGARSRLRAGEPFGAPDDRQPAGGRPAGA